jgi:hypothetical protein
MSGEEQEGPSSSPPCVEALVEGQNANDTGTRCRTQMGARKCRGHGVEWRER